MKWFSPRQNPAAIYLPQFLSAEEERLLVRSLQHASAETQNRGKASGPVNLKDGGHAYITPSQLGTLDLLETIDYDGTRLMRIIVERAEDEKRKPPPAKLPTWTGGKDGAWSSREWNAWVKRIVALPLAQRKKVVTKFRTNHQSRPYGNVVRSSLIGNFGRDTQNPWARECSWNIQNPYDWRRALPIIQRIDRAFQLALPERYAIQKEYVEQIHPAFRIPDTVFTTVTVNTNYRTYAHRDQGNLRQGFSNLLIMGYGKPFSGGHFILPEFGVEFPLKPRDLLFVQNDEYIHSNTPIIKEDATSSRMALVLYVRESALFSGTPAFEEYRKQFSLSEKKKKRKVRERIYESKEWFGFLKTAVTKKAHNTNFLDAARKEKLLNVECVYNSFKWEYDPLFEPRRYQYVCKFQRPPLAEFKALEALFAVHHFKTARQDRIIYKGQKERSDDGLNQVDAVFLGTVNGSRWGISYVTSDSGAPIFNNNRFNPQVVAKLPSIPSLIEKLSRASFEWLKKRWDEEKTVYLIYSPTEIPEVPFRVAFTTLSPQERSNKEHQERFRQSKLACYEQADGIGMRSLPAIFGSNTELLDLGYRSVGQSHGVLQRTTPVVCDALELRYASEQQYLKEHLAHWVRRAEALGNDDYKNRYRLIGIYASETPRFARNAVNQLNAPWEWDVTAKHLTLRRKDHVPLSFRCVKSHGRWRAAALTAPFLSVHFPSAYIKLWIHKESSGKTGQVTVSDGANFFLFQSISRHGFICADDVTEMAAHGARKKLTTSCRILHAQRQNNIQPLKPQLLKRIRRLPGHHISAIPLTDAERHHAIENFQIAIPSYGRSNMLPHCTLKMLERYRVDPKRVTIFIADAITERLWVEDKIRGKSKPDDWDEREYQERHDGSGRRKIWIRHTKELEGESDVMLYKKRLAGNPYGKRIVVGVKGIGPQRNFIQNYYPDGTHLISLDDDLSGLFELLLNHTKTRKGKWADQGIDVGGKEFHRIIKQGFAKCHESGSHLFGVYASNERNQGAALRAMTGKDYVQTKPGYIIGACYGTIIRHSNDLNVRLLNHGEDQERTLRFLAKDGIVLRFNKYSINKGTVFFSLGGLQQARQEASAKTKKGVAKFENEIRSLATEFPQYCSAIVPNKKDTWELRWKTKGAQV